MDYESMDFNRSRWNRMMLNGLWLLVFITISLECMHIATDHLIAYTFVSSTIFIPAIIQLLLLLAAEAGLKWFQGKYQDHILIVVSAVIAAAIVYMYESFEYLLLALFLPVMMSIFYFQSKKMLFALISAMTSMYLLYAVSPTMRSELSVVNLITITVIFLSFSLIAWGIILRGKELMNHLKTSFESNRQLLVKTVVMDKLTKTDALTELYNHISFHEFFDRSIEQHERNQLALQLAIIDIDNFKQINDTYGHRAGDAVLQDVARTIQAVASLNDFAARYGGEEFVVLFTDKPVSESYELAEQMRATISRLAHDELGGQPVTVSVGFGNYTAGEGKERFFNRVDEALYKAKSGGKNRTMLAAVPPKTRYA